ncbi:MAG TPA: DUF2018 family protein [Campylobacterales bacterium]|nr:DUF2018 family protein [Campylobacterales bacterium]
MMQLFDEDDELFGGTVVGKLVDILGNANKNLVELELERLLTRMAAMEMMLEEKGVSEAEIKSFIFENADNLRDMSNSLALTLTADIVTQNE